MSGHSKWSKIKRKKGANDAKRGQIFTKFGKAITLAAKEGGGDPDMNFNLRLAIDKAKTMNMPADNIKRAVDKGAGSGSEAVIYSKVSYEAFGPDNTALIIDCNTDNTNRTVAEVKKIVESNGGKFAGPGSVSWQFEEIGSIVLSPKILQKSDKFGSDDFYIDVEIDDMEMGLIDIEGVDDIRRDRVDGMGSFVHLSTSKLDFAKVLSEVDKLKYKVESAELAKISKDPVDRESVNEEKISSFIEKIEDHDDVDSVWVNIK